MGASTIVPAEPDHPRHSEASVVRLDDRRLMLVWSAFRAIDDAPATSTSDPTAREWSHSRDNNPAELRVSVSSDDGETWSRSRTLVENDAAINVMQASLARLPDGGIGLSYSRRESRTRSAKLFRRSDEGERWGEAVDVTGIEGYISGPNDRLAVLASGRILQPVQQLFDGWIAVRVAWSDDGGRSWGHSALLQVPTPVSGALYGFWEASIAQRDDGSLLLVGRTALGQVYAAESGDDGETWTAPAPTGVTAPSAPPLLRRLPSGPLMLLHNTAFEPGSLLQGGRSTLAASLSDDGGATWRDGTTIEHDDERWFHYPSCLIEGPRAYLTYSVTDPETRLWSLRGRWLDLP